MIYIDYLYCFIIVILEQHWCSVQIKRIFINANEKKEFKAMHWSYFYKDEPTIYKKR